jgi:hypothetical protein
VTGHPRSVPDESFPILLKPNLFNHPPGFRANLHVKPHLQLNNSSQWRYTGQSSFGWRSTIKVEIKTDESASTDGAGVPYFSNTYPQMARYVDLAGKTLQLIETRDESI